MYQLSSIDQSHVNDNLLQFSLWISGYVVIRSYLTFLTSSFCLQITAFNILLFFHVTIAEMDYAKVIKLWVYLNTHILRKMIVNCVFIRMIQIHMLFQWLWVYMLFDSVLFISMMCIWELLFTDFKSADALLFE